MSNELATAISGDLPLIFELAKQLVPTGMLPNHIKQPGQAVAIILAGRELGMEPMRALRSLQMVQGKVIESADSQLGRFKAAGGRAVFESLTDTEAKLRLTHPNGDEHTESFSIAQAKAAGLASKDIWQKYPKAMLRSRVITAGLKSVGWDGSVGQYDPEEAEEIGGGRSLAVVANEPVVQMPRRLSDRSGTPSAAAVVEAQVDEPEPPPPPAEPEDDIEALLDASIENAKAAKAEPKISEKDRRHLMGLMNEHGHTKDGVSAYLRTLGFASSKDITVSAFGGIKRRLEDKTPLVA
jgi:hypothetical protein